KLFPRIQEYLGDARDGPAVIHGRLVRAGPGACLSAEGDLRVTTTRRRIAALLVALGAACATGTGAATQAAPREFRIGYQKVGVVVVARQRGAIEKRLAPQGIAV